MTLPIGGSAVAGNPNELSRLLLVESIVVDGTLAVDGPIRAWGSSQDLAVRLGRSYSDKAPGLSFAAVPLALALDPLLPRNAGGRYAAYEPLRHALTWALAALPAAVIPFVMLAGRNPGGPLPGRWMALLFGLCTPLLTYGTLFFSHVAAGALVGGAWMLLSGPNSGSHRAGGADYPLLAGLLAGLAVATEYTTAILAVILIAFAFRLGGARTAAFVICGMVAGVAPALVYHHLAFGTAWTTGYAFKTDPAHAALHARGLFGLGAPSIEALGGVLLSGRRGMLVYSPILILVPLGLWRMLREKARGAGFLVASLAAWLLFAACFPDWEGGWCAAARHLVPALPLALVPLAAAVEGLWRSTRGRLLVCILGGASLAGTLLSLAVTPLFPENFHWPIGQVVLPALLEGAAMPSLTARLLSLDRHTAALLWAAAALCAAVLSIVRMAPRGKRLAAVTALTAAAIVTTVMHKAMAPSLTPDQIHTRAFVMDRLGYRDLALRIDAGADAPP